VSRSPSVSPWDGIFVGSAFLISWIVFLIGYGLLAIAKKPRRAI
jgi:hypothetical protein